MTEDWQYPYEGGTEPDAKPKATVEEFPFQHTPVQWVISESSAPADPSESDPWVIDLASRNTSEVSVKPEDEDAGHLVVKQNYTRSSSTQTCVSKKRQRKLYKFVSERVDSPEKEKRSREQRSTACDECSRRKVKCTGETHGRSCQRCYERNHLCTWHKKNGMDRLGNIRFEHCRPVQA